MRRLCSIGICLGFALSMRGSALADMPQLYFADNNTDTINRMNLDGSGLEIVAHTNRVLLALTIDASSGKIFWCDNGLSWDNNGRARIHRADLDGSNPEIIYESVLTKQGETVQGLVVDGGSQQLYWFGSKGSARVMRMNTDGTDVTPIIENDPDYRGGLELDPVNRKLYFNYAYGGSTHIARADLDGSNREPLVETSAYSLFLDAPDNRLLCADYFDNKVFEVDLDTRQRHDLFYIPSPRDVVRFGEYLYCGTGGALIQQTDLDGSNPIALARGGPGNPPFDPIDLHIIPEPTTGIMVFQSLIGAGLLACRRRVFRKRSAT